MPNEILNEPSSLTNNFAKTACNLLLEYTNRLISRKEKSVNLIQRFSESRSKKESYLADQLFKLYQDEKEDFFQTQQTYTMLIRKVSQWFEHGKTPDPNLELELSVRLIDLQTHFESLNQFYHNNHL